MNCKVCKNGDLYDLLTECTKIHSAPTALSKFDRLCMERGDTRNPIRIFYSMISRGCSHCDKRKEYWALKNSLITNQKESIAFAILPDGTFAMNGSDKRGHRTYLKEDFHIPAEEIKNLTMGYIMPGRIVIYKTLNYLNPGDEKVLECLKTIGITACQFYGDGKYDIWSGVKYENGVWKPLFQGNVNLKLSFGKRYHELEIESTE